MRQKICIFTGTRAEYGLLFPLMKEVRDNQSFELQILVTGMHLSPEFGLTYKEIEKDGWCIDEKVEMLLSSDTDLGITKSTGLGLIGLGDAFFRLKPNLVVILGDRFEAFAAATAAYLQKIPIAHIHGGETTEGATDEAFRHAITKMSYLHFTSTEAYRKRVIQLGESPERVFNVGAIGLDNIKNLPLLTKSDLEKSLDFELGNSYAIITFHPVTLEDQSAESQIEALLNSLDKIKHIKLLFTLPNADANGRIIIEKIKSFVALNQLRSKDYISLGQLRYLSALKYTTVVIGNSSSGIIEAPSFGIPIIDIGDRQKGRIKSSSVINTLPDEASIILAIEKALTPDFQSLSKKSENPYGKGDTAIKILKQIKQMLPIISLKKTFYDIK